MELQTAQGQAIIGTPPLVPLPRMVTLSFNFPGFELVQEGP